MVFILFMVLFSLDFAASSTVFDSRTRCLLYKNRCVNHCPRMMHPYHTRCDGETISQRTCYSPEVYTLGFTCGWSRCDCNGDKLLNEVNGLCVPEHECTRPLPARHTRRRRPGEGAKMPKNIRINDEEPIERVMKGD